MKQYSLIKASKDNIPYILDALKMILGNHIQIEHKKDYILVEHEAMGEEAFEVTIKSLEEDLNTLISYYQTRTDRAEKELLMIENYFEQAKYGHYHLKSFIPQIESRNLKLEIFYFITEGMGIYQDIIYAMADSDLNVSKASALLYMHRNTLLYKIERLNEMRNFDLKKFHDLYLLIFLLNL